MLQFYGSNYILILGRLFSFNYDTPNEGQPSIPTAEYLIFALYLSNYHLSKYPQCHLVTLKVVIRQYLITDCDY